MLFILYRGDGQDPVTDTITIIPQSAREAIREKVELSVWLFRISLPGAGSGCFLCIYQEMACRMAERNSYY